MRFLKWMESLCGDWHTNRPFTNSRWRAWRHTHTHTFTCTWSSFFFCCCFLRKFLFFLTQFQFKPHSIFLTATKKGIGGTDDADSPAQPQPKSLPHAHRPRLRRRNTDAVGLWGSWRRQRPLSESKRLRHHGGCTQKRSKRKRWTWSWLNFATFDDVNDLKRSQVSDAEMFFSRTWCRFGDRDLQPDPEDLRSWHLHP